MFDVWDQFGLKRAKMLTDEFQILSRVTLFLKKKWLVSDGSLLLIGNFRSLQIVPGGFRWFQVVSDGFKWFQLVSDDSGF